MKRPHPLTVFAQYLASLILAPIYFVHKKIQAIRHIKLPSKEQLLEFVAHRKYLQFLHPFIKPDYLWHFNRKSVARGMALGFFFMFLLIPGHTVLVILLAFAWRANLPIALLLIWLTNPLMFVPLAYPIGAWILQTSLPQNALNQKMYSLASLGYPFLVGSVALSIVTAVVSFVLTEQIWRCRIRRRWARHSS